MSVSVIRSKLNTRLSAISAVGIVHDFKRLVMTWSDFETKFVESSKVNTWIIQRYNGSVYSWDQRNVGGVNPLRTFEVWGLLSLSDADESEKDFDDIVAAVEDDFSNNRILDTAFYKIEAITTSLDEYQFCGVLCNRCVLTLQIREHKEYV